MIAIIFIAAIGSLYAVLNMKGFKSNIVEYKATNYSVWRTSYPNGETKEYEFYLMPKPKVKCMNAVMKNAVIKELELTKEVEV